MQDRGAIGPSVTPTDQLPFKMGRGIPRLVAVFDEHLPWQAADHPPLAPTKTDGGGADRATNTTPFRNGENDIFKCILIQSNHSSVPSSQEAYQAG